MADQPSRRRRFQFRLRRKTASLVLTGCGLVYLFGTLEIVVMWGIGVPTVRFSALVVVAVSGALMLASGLWLRRGRIHP
jgi:hypothetical protein